MKELFFKRATLLASVITLFLVSCGKTSDGFQANEDSRYLYPFTPIQLSLDSVVFYLDDYFPEEQVDSFRFPSTIRVASTTDPRVFTLHGNIGMAIDAAIFYTKKGVYNIPVYQSEKVQFTYQLPKSVSFNNSIAIKGTFNSWNTLANPFELRDGIYESTMILTPGKYEYVLVADGKEVLDPEQSEVVSNGMGGFNSVLTIESGKSENCSYMQALGYDKGSVRISGLQQGQSIMVFFNNQRLPDRFIKINPEHVDIVFPLASVRFPRSWLRVFSYSEGCRNNEILIPLTEGNPVTSYSQLTKYDWHSTVWYFLMVDRFLNGNPSNDQKVDDPEILPIANYFGGDIEGIRKKIEEGYFDSLGVNAIWLSPITQNPSGAWGLWDKGGVRTRFSGYHGYWPISNVRVDHRFGTDSELRSLLSAGHRREFRFILDYVANHVHQEHPVYQANPHWATSLYLPDGTLNTERWDDYRLTTWFDVFMPTLDLTRQEIVEPMTDSALVWINDYGFDGFRHDATKHIDELFWRTLTRKIKKLDRVLKRSDRIYQIGETYGSPELIASYISTGMLDAQFDFNLYDAAIRYFATGETADLEKLITTIRTSLKTYGMHHLMGNITGNQDRPRFISLASGDVRFDEDTKLAGYIRQIGKPKSEAYLKLQMLTAFNMALAGIPILYYGDEIGMPGANDPDNRRMMKFTNWDADEASTFEITRRLIALRKYNLPLIYGTTSVFTQNNILIVDRNYLGKRIKVFFNNTNQELPMPAGKVLLTNSSDDRLKPYTFSFVEEI